MKKNLHGGHVHDAPEHERTKADVTAEHIGDDDFGEVDVSDGSVAGVIEVLGEEGVSATRDEKVERVLGS